MPLCLAVARLPIGSTFEYRSSVLQQTNTTPGWFLHLPADYDYARRAWYRGVRDLLVAAIRGADNLATALPPGSS